MKYLEFWGKIIFHKYLGNIKQFVFRVEPVSLVVSISHLLNCPGEILPRLLQLGGVVVRDDLVYQALFAGQKSHGELRSFLQ